MRRLWLSLFVLVLSAPIASAQRVVVETLTDVELFKTDARGSALSADDGTVAHTLRLHAWVFASLTSKLQFLGVVEHEREGNDQVSDAEILQLRYAHSRALVVDVGRLVAPLGSFGVRRFSSTNPVIGGPAAYPVPYPQGVMLSGATGAWDYKAGVVSQPTVDEESVPKPTDRPHPVIGLGWSAGPSFRIGAAASSGAYLGTQVQSLLAAGARWDAYREQALNLDARWSVGYLEARAEGLWRSHETGLGTLWTSAYVGEARYTVSPRWFVAARVEDDSHPTVAVISGAVRGSADRELVAEAGLGYRASPDLLLKSSVRVDRWPGSATPNGMAFGVQLSWYAHLTDWLDATFGDASASRPTAVPRGH